MDRIRSEKIGKAKNKKDSSYNKEDRRVKCSREIWISWRKESREDLRIHGTSDIRILEQRESAARRKMDNRLENEYVGFFYRL